MARIDILKEIYCKKRLIKDFDFDGLFHAPISCYLSEEDISRLKYFSTSAKWSSKKKADKFAEMDKIMYPRGFERFHSGTNRLIYKNIYDHSFLIKVAIDEVGISDNPDEYYNQSIMKPFVTKVFDVSPCGTVSMVERVNPISNRLEFEDIATQVFDILNNFFIGKYVLEDIGTDFFMNWGVRDGFGPVILDFPYVYETDGDKLQCPVIRPDGSRCTGTIDYDDGLNTLVCEHCNQRQSARSLGKTSNLVSVKSKIIGEVSDMEQEIQVSISKGGKIFKLYSESDHIPPKKNRKHSSGCREEEIVAYITGGYSKPTIKDIVASKMLVGENPLVELENRLKASKQEDVIVTQTVTTTPQPAQEEEGEFTEVPKPVFESSKENSVLVDQDPKTEKEFADTARKEQEELESKESKDKNVPAKERAQINKFMTLQMKKFPFDRYLDPSQEQRKDMIDYLVSAVSLKYSPEPEIAIMIVSEYVDSHYQFVADGVKKAEALAEEYYGDKSYEDQEKVKPIKTSAKRDTVASEY